MTFSLPYDLKQVENDLSISLTNFLQENTDSQLQLSINLKFDGLRLNPIILRLSNHLKQYNYDNILLWSDAGASALAKRDMSDISDQIYTYIEYLEGEDSLNGKMLLAIAPQPYDINIFEEICDKHKSFIIMIYGRLEDPAVGIGSVGRERRKRLVSLWKTIYYLEPLSKGALLKKYSLTETVQIVHKLSNISKKEVYKMALKIKNG